MRRQSTDGHERRRHRRIAAALPFRILSDGVEKSFDLLDLSESGVRIRCAHSMSPMTRIEVALMLPGERVGAKGQVRLETTGVVVWSHKDRDRRFDTGVFFADLDDRQRTLLQAFVGSYP